MIDKKHDDLLEKVIRQDISNSFDDNMVFFNMMTLWGDA
jgi:hypothetical protein